MKALLSRLRIKQALTLILVSALLVLNSSFLTNSSVNAGQLLNRKLELGNADPVATNIHTFTFDITNASSVGSIKLEYCSNTPLFTVACIPSTGLDLSSVILSNQVGETGFSIHSSSNANTIVLTRTPSVTVPGTSVYEFSLAVNPDTPGTHYVRLSTQASDDGTGARIDEGGIAYTINDVVAVAAYVPPRLDFCLGQTITGTNCATATGNNLNFGTLDDNQTRFGTTQMVVGTNAYLGYTITVTGTTMTAGNKIITPLSTPGPAISGLSQFGLNLVDNNSPNVGEAATGVGSGVPSPNYGVVDNFVFNSGDIIASAVVTTEYNKFTTSYIVNVNADQPPGVYTTTLTYIALASF